MLKLLLSKDRVAGRAAVFALLKENMQRGQHGAILLVPDQITHNMERRLCETLGDSADRFAEVLPFRRLENRIGEYCHEGCPEVLDQGGRLVAMAMAGKNLSSKVKVYAGMSEKPEFLSQLLTVMDELKQSRITPAALLSASRQTEGAFAQKLSDLSLLADAYEGICALGKRDPREGAEHALNLLKRCDYAEQHPLYIEGFTEFTAQNYSIIEHFLENSDQVTVSLCCDALGSQKPGMESAGRTAARLYQFAQDHAIPVELLTVPGNHADAAEIALSGSLSKGQFADFISAMEYDSVYEALAVTMEDILSSVRQGSRFRDHVVLCTDMAACRPFLQLIASQYGVPIYLSGTEDILQKPVIQTLLSAVEAAVGDLEQEDVLRYLKSPLSPISGDLCDRVENYALQWGIRGNKWLVPWEKHPEGLEADWTEESKKLLVDLNEARKLAMEPLGKFRRELRSAICVKEQVKSLLAFLEEISFQKRMEEMAEHQEAIGDLRGAQILSQLWEIVLTALEQMYDIIGESYWEGTRFSRLLSLLLSQYHVGTIPTVLDSVICGTAADIRGHEAKYLHIIGADEGTFPGYSSGVGLLTDQDRIALQKIGIQISGTAMDRLQIEFSNIYNALCGSAQHVWVLAAKGEGSFIFRRMADMSGGICKLPELRGVSCYNAAEAGIHLAGLGQAEFAEKLDLRPVYEAALRQKEYAFGNVQRKRIPELYGNTLRLSASQIDRMSICQLSYYLQYGLRAKELKELTVDPTEFGSYVHAVLEETAKTVLERGGFPNVSLEDTMEIAHGLEEKYVAEHFAELDSERVKYLLNRNRSEVAMVVQELWEELSESDFVPAGFEVGFGEGEAMPPIEIPNPSMKAILRGFVDRVDVYERQGQHFFRVVDYKTGKKEFDYCDVIHGVGLQMLLYLFALQQNGAALLGENPSIAGVQYFPARAELLPFADRQEDDSIVKERLKRWKRSGLLLRDEGVLYAMEHEDKPVRTQYKISKDGELSGSLADDKQWKMLEKYIRQYLAELVERIASGSVEANPYTRDETHNPCNYCPYTEICHSECITCRRTFKKIDSAEFWEEIGKKVKEHG